MLVFPGHLPSCVEDGKCKMSQVDNASRSWVIEVKSRFRSGEYKKGHSSDKVCIYKVPKMFMDCQSKNFVPEVVSFGPFHHNENQKLLAMEDHKLEAVRRTLVRLKDMQVDELIRIVEESDNEIRECYEGHAIEHNKEKLAWMITMDACFILEFFRAKMPSWDRMGFSLVFGNSTGRGQTTLSFEIFKDILKLENQIPLFILIRILELEFRTQEAAVSALANMLNGYYQFRGFLFSTEALKQYRLMERIKSKMKEQIKGGSVCHLLDLCRKLSTDFLTTSSGHSVPDTRAEGCTCVVRCNPHWHRRTHKTAMPTHRYEIPRAELLHDAGIEFKVSEKGNIWFEKRSFGGSTLFLPQIIIFDTTESILRNVIAFDECNKFKEKNLFSHYISLMNKLIDTEKDAALLQKEGIIVSFVESDAEIKDIFNRMGHGITVKSVEEIAHVVKEVKEEYNSKIKVWISQFVEEHCSKPWYVISLVVGFLVLVMTTVQTVCSLKNW